MRFIDEARVFVHAGKGGNGAIAFLREKFRPFGGPAGGNGGRGGSVIFQVDEGLSTLLDFKYQPRLIAKDGEPGRGKEQYGHGADDIVVRVPPGTIVFDEESGATLADLVMPGESAVIAQGGHGGTGNMHFASSTRRSPRIATPGTAGEQRWIRMELRLVAEVGLVGMPNAGKSTLLAALSAARPKIAPYPFTTLAPNLGRVILSDVESFTVADIPGLIEGAHEGHGLGIRFLRHVSRTRILAHLVDVSDTGRDPVHDLEVILAELASFSDDLANKPMIVVATKMDAAQDPKRVAALQRLARKRGMPFFKISSVTGEGIKELKRAMAKRVLAPSDAEALEPESH